MTPRWMAVRPFCPWSSTISCWKCYRGESCW